MKELFEKRINQLREIFTSDKEAVLLSNDVNIGYFCGFFHSEGYLIITQNSSYLMVDFRYFEAAQKRAQCCEVICFKKLSDDLVSVFTKEKTEYVLIEEDNLTVERFDFFKMKFSEHNISTVASDQLTDKIRKIRIIKDETELDRISTAQKIAEKAYSEMLNFVKPGVSERELAARLEFLMKLEGAEAASFDLITITGKKTSLPHGVPSDDIIKNGDFLTCDFGAVYEGYHSDTTRTVAVGFATDEMREIYDIVLRAQLAALDKIRAGVLCSDIDREAREIIENSGYGKYFGHSTGHGVGLDIHESPAVSPRGMEVLKAGMVITDEPGIYLPDKFGVRIEDMLCVTESGCKNFVSLPKELVIL